MKKTLWLLLFIASTCTLFAQKYTSKTAILNFEANTVAFEEVAAVNKNSGAILEASSGEIVVLAMMKGFHFKSALMQEHFNENYVESEKYPKATFKGKIDNFKATTLSSTPQNFTISGDLNIHGKTKKIVTVVKISKQENTITIVGNFEVKPEEFGIEIPKLITKKIAEKVKVSFILPLNN